jgi:hypothetical protein
MQNLWALINSLQILSYMAFLWLNLTPQLTIVFDMLLVSHFDVIPLKDMITDSVKRSIESGKIKKEAPYTENMGIFDYETTLAIVNLIDTVIVMTILLAIYGLLRLASLITKGCP